ncbi:hypothetical protein, partial [Phocaeicola sp.]
VESHTGGVIITKDRQFLLFTVNTGTFSHKENTFYWLINVSTHISISQHAEDNGNHCNKRPICIWELKPNPTFYEGIMKEL